MKPKIRKAMCLCDDCERYRMVKNDPSVKAMQTLLKSDAKMSSEDKAEIRHYIRQRKLALWREYG
jgi:hypothetical protein